MGYLHISNLYKLQDILLFKECYALEKIHGTSAHLAYNPQTKELTFFSGGEKHDRFVSIFNKEELKTKFEAMGVPVDRTITVYGEAYGGSQQGMSETYGKSLKFIVFDVQIGECWLDVPKAEKVAQDLGLEFVHYVKVSTDLKELDAQRDAPSVQAIRNGISQTMPIQEGFNPSTSPEVKIQKVESMGCWVINPRKREGVVLRPLVEFTKNNGERIICKHKGDDFKETATPRPVVDPAKMQVLADAQAVADEWVTLHRLEHVLQKIENPGIEKMREVIAAMVEDVNREGKNEFIPSQEVDKAIGRKTALLYKDYLKSNLYQK